MTETKLTGPSMEERISNRLKNSGEGARPDVHVQRGEGPTRTHTNIHHSPGSKARGGDGGDKR
jgi:hypothetical protein